MCKNRREKSFPYHRINGTERAGESVVHQPVPECVCAKWAGSVTASRPAVDSHVVDQALPEAGW